MTFTNDSNISKIEGTWNNDTLENSKLLTMRDGSTATNYCAAKGKLFGQGEVKVGQSIFTGTWDESGRLSGEGTIEVGKSKGLFKGMFKGNVRSGEGKYVWPDDQGEYTGPYKNGERHTG